ncbi:MAG: nuclear transport factor 2 family protein [Pseudomonadales bacterium]|nr:nuclear transport factor 2 family protein [Pseudomonadales bacterium]
MNSEPGSIPSADEVGSRLAIQELLHLHSRALDRQDAALMKSVYWSDATVDYGGFKGAAHEFADLVMNALAAQYELTQHRVSNTVFVFSSDHHAATESYVFAKHLRQDAASEMVFSGRYLDEFHREAGVWKFRRRTVVMDWSRDWVVEDQRQTGSMAALTKGLSNPDDPSWAHLDPKGL